MRARYNHKTKTFTVAGIPALTAHHLIWGGSGSKLADAIEAFRQALVDAEDNQMTDDEYKEMRDADSE